MLRGVNLINQVGLNTPRHAPSGRLAQRASVLWFLDTFRDASHHHEEARHSQYDRGHIPVTARGVFHVEHYLFLSLRLAPDR